MNKRLMLGTAGHIDHGKSSLVQCLTGVDPDRLPEEKKRGITIELGFANLELKNYSFGVVDVPGHERFVRTMVSGATGIDLVILVVAADEGVMPQTREHLDICTLLGIRHGLVALTKVDLVDSDWLELVNDELRTELEGSFLAEAPIIECSTKSLVGIEELKQALEKLAEQVNAREHKAMTKLPIDRVFEQKGFGPVITGTLHAGRLKVGDQITLLPAQLEGRVRGIQVHSQVVEEASAGQRTAINLQGIELRAIKRGQVLIHSQQIEPTQEIDAKLQLLSHLKQPLKQRSPVLLHAGTVQLNARIWIFGKDRLMPGEEAFARFMLEEPTILQPGDRFILRGFQRFEKNGTTIGGGEVLDPFPPQKRKRDPYLLERLQLIDKSELEGVLELLLKESTQVGMTLHQLLTRTKAGHKQMEQSISLLLRKGTIVRFDRDPAQYIHTDELDKLSEQAQSKLEEYHSENPLEDWMSREAFKEQLGIENHKLFSVLVQRMSKADLLLTEKAGVKLKVHRVRLQADQAKLEDELYKLYQKAGFTPPRSRDLGAIMNIEDEDVKPILELLSRRKQLIRVFEDLYFSDQNIQKLQNDLVAHLTKNETITAQEFKQLTGASRKFTIPLAEYFDKQQVTFRVGDIRKVRNPV